ncbi:uncharacterized protein CDV56_108439 [Aspergillus thermomutatus]|uniref:Secreted protein CSS2 C-terminal domain-containing protein n=1 Tax=Aspergillus thermomutatus TaxID=41047 RepID=A0A397HVB7_ASPTH|nr:uncharacterized protein CDV56_108439 [Aspergillus thermomutatus]RHZ66747.1 hypothetical protein CDV56_108439 [Aspergillus thermomutatus]
MPSFQDFHIFCIRTLPPILLYTLIVLNALHYYVTREDCVPNHLLRANLEICAFLAFARHQRRALDKRTPSNVGQAVLVTVACLGILSHVIDYSPGLAGVIKGLSDQQHSCRHMTGTFDNVKWSFSATGQHCDTAAQQATIQDAVAKYIQNAENGKICGTQCLRLNHGGTWDGWLKLGSVSSFNENAYCAVGLPFDKCISGGNNDI